MAAVSVFGLAVVGCSTSNAPQAQQAALGTKSEPVDGLPANLPDLNAETRFAAGQVDESQHNLDGAIGQYQEALKINPKHLAALYRLGIVYTEVKQYAKAVEIWQRYVQASGKSATAYADLGFCQDMAGQTDQAEASYKAGIAVEAKNVPCRVNYGLLLARHERVADAIEQWQAVLSPAEVHYNLGGVYAAQGNKAKARAEFNKALELDPGFNDAKQRVSALDAN
jgi:tetratricopeptide (TPR) repeat protein